MLILSKMTSSLFSKITLRDRRFANRRFEDKCVPSHEIGKERALGERMLGPEEREF